MRGRKLVELGFGMVAEACNSLYNERVTKNALVRRESCNKGSSGYLFSTSNFYTNVHEFNNLL